MQVWQKAVQLWDAGQVSHHGTYSLARFASFHEYSQKSTWYRVVIVLILTTLPSLIMMAIIDSVPLQDPSEGWKANWVFWVRCALALFALTFASVLQFHVTAPAAVLSVKKCVLIAVVVSVGYPISAMGVASFWGFPIPFQMITCVPIWDFWLIASMVFVLGRENLASNTELRHQTKRYLDILQAQAPLLLVYPGYSAVFMRLSRSHQTAFIFVLPIVKFLLKNVLAKASAGLGDFIPTIVISIDLFNAIYQLKSMQSAGSIYTSAGIVLIDVIQNVVSMWRLHRHVHGLCALQSVNGKSPSSLNLLNIIAESCQNSDLLENQYWLSLQKNTGTTIASTSKKPTTSKHSGIFGRNRIVPNDLQKKNGTKPICKVSVQPIDQNAQTQDFSTNFDHVNSTSIFTAGNSLRENRTLMIKRSLQLLRRTEFMLLVEYIECAIPVLYIAYLPILCKFQNRKYYPDVENITETRLRHIITTISAYALCELGSLLYVHWVIMRNFQFSALRQLAFILERDFLVIQASFMAWTLIIFQFLVVHFGKFSRLNLVYCCSKGAERFLYAGADFTFKFSWLNS